MSAELLGLVRGFVVAQSLYVAARLGVADALAGGPRTAGELAGQAGADPDALRRLLRALCTVEVFAPAAGDRFALGRLGPGLLATGPGSVRNWVLLNGELLYRAFGGMLDSVRTGRPAFERSLFEYLDGAPGEAGLFHAAMADVSPGAARALLDGHDFSGATHVVDVGGGSGKVLAALLQAYPRLRGTLVDRPAAIRAARATMVAAGVAARCRLRRGDFFREVPRGADVYLLSWILHDWADDRALDLLRCCRRAAPDGARLLLVEAVLPPPDQAHPAHFGDLVMLVALGGRERTAAEYADLLAAAGFQLTRVLPTGDVRSVIEAVAVR